jgi:hypothetical protein
LEKKSEQLHDDLWLKDLPIRSDAPEFGSEELIACEICERQNPPNRMKCLYCGAELSNFDPKLVRPALDKLETHEKGINVLLRSAASGISEEQISAAARLLKLETDSLSEILRNEKSLPLVRVRTESEVNVVRERLRDLGIETSTLTDETFALGVPAIRLRSMRFEENELGLVLYNQDDIRKVAKSEVFLVVTGSILERRLATSESLKRSKSKVLETEEIATDEQIADLYIRSRQIPFRIVSTGFDFSFLGNEMKLLAKENFGAMLRRLSKWSNDIKFDDDYLKCRAALSNVWEVDESYDSRGVQRNGFGKFKFESATSISNVSQLDRYSRLQFHLLNSALITK